MRAVEIASDAGVAVSYDPNYRHQLWTPEEARRGMDEVLPSASYALPSVPSDSHALFGVSDPRTAVETMLEKGVGVVAVKYGAAGVVVGTDGEVFEVPAYSQGPAIDTTGAGDAFNGGFLHGLLRGMSPRDAAVLGSIGGWAEGPGPGCSDDDALGRRGLRHFRLPCASLLSPPSARFLARLRVSRPYLRELSVTVKPPVRAANPRMAHLTYPGAKDHLAPHPGT